MKQSFQINHFHCLSVQFYLAENFIVICKTFIIIVYNLLIEYSVFSKSVFNHGGAFNHAKIDERQRIFKKKLKATKAFVERENLVFFYFKL